MFPAARTPTRANIHAALPSRIPGGDPQAEPPPAAGRHSRSLGGAGLRAPGFVRSRRAGLPAQLRSGKPEASYCAGNTARPATLSPPSDSAPRWASLPAQGKQPPPSPAPSPFSSPQRTEAPKKFRRASGGPCPPLARRQETKGGLEKKKKQKKTNHKTKSLGLGGVGRAPGRAASARPPARRSAGPPARPRPPLGRARRYLNRATAVWFLLHALPCCSSTPCTISFSSGSRYTGNT